MEKTDIDKEKAYRQWKGSIRRLRKEDRILTVNYETFNQKYKKASEYPDIVFCANHGLALPKSKKYLISNMNNVERKLEPEYFALWAQNHGYDVIKMNNNINFEGEGDAKWHPDRNILWIGHGFRTNKKAVREISSIVDAEVKSLRLTSNYYYHLDLCFEPVNSNTAIVVDDAFTEDGISKLNENFKNLIMVPESDIETMGGNCSRVNGKVVIDSQNKETIKVIEDRGFEVIKVETSEFMKAGGSIDCLFMRIL